MTQRASRQPCLGIRWKSVFSGNLVWKLLFVRNEQDIVPNSVVTVGEGQQAMSTEVSGEESALPQGLHVPPLGDI